MAADVVVEVGERIALGIPERARHPPQPSLAVPAPILPRRAMKPQISEPAGVRGRLAVDQVVLAEGGAVAIEQLAALVGIPGGAAELDRVADILRERGDEARKPREVLPVHLRRKLPEDGAELVAEPQHQLEVPIEALPRLLEPLEMSEVAASLAGEEEAPGRAPPPAFDHGSGRQAVEGGVQLDGVKHLRVAREPTLPRDAGIEQVLPVLVDVAAGSDADHGSKMLIPPAPRRRGARRRSRGRCSPRRR